MSSLNIATAEVFEPLLVTQTYKGAHGGRGSGKSHFFAGLLVEELYCNPGWHALCAREVQKTLATSAKRLIETKIAEFGLSSEFDIRNDFIRTPGRGEITFTGLQDHTADSIKSYEGIMRCWVEEAQSITERSVELLLPTIRADGSEVWFSWNPRNASDPVDKMFRGENPRPDTICVRSNWSNNPWITAKLMADMEADRVSKPDRFAHIWLGEYEPRAVGAIWSREVLHANRRSEMPDLERVVVAVDPAITEDGDEHGIVVAAVGQDQRGYVLDDASCQGTPQEWAQRAWAMFDKWDADAMVIERNQGGDMCREVLRSVRPSPRPIEVVATKGKHVRAEPIASLYQLGNASHVGTFPELEGQMCQMTHAGYQGEGSPDRVDALVWAMTELFPKMVKRPVTKPKAPRRLADGQTGWMAA